MIKSNSAKKSATAGKHERRILVVGGGGGGLAAALTAAEKGREVILLEKNRNPGGNSALAGGIGAVESHVQKRLNIDVSRDRAFKAAMEFSHWSIDPRIFRAFLDKSADTLLWLEEKGVRFTHIINLFPGSPFATWHTQPKGLGLELVRTLRKKCEEAGVQVVTRAPARKILKDTHGKVRGVLAAPEGKDVEIEAKSVIIATGGYAGNKEMMEKYFPSYKDYHLYGARLKGDGILMAIEAGAATEGLGHCMLHPLCYPQAKDVDDLIREPFLLWVNKRGERFADETIGFHHTACGNALERQPDRLGYVLFDEGVKRKIVREGRVCFGMGPVFFSGGNLPNIDKQLPEQAARGGVKISDSWSDIARWIGVAPKVLRDTVREYNSFCAQGYDEHFGKDRRYLHALNTPPFYGVRCKPSMLNTIGGIKINHRMEVLDKEDEPIPGLYAVGDAAGGWETATYFIELPGSAFGFAVNSGRIAAENASEFITRS